MSPPLKKQAAEWVALAAFAQPHGVSGRIKVKSLSDGPDDFADHEHLTDERGNHVNLRLTGHAQGMAVVEIEGVTTREGAELLRGKKIGAPRAALPEQKNPNRYYIRDLVGMAVIDAENRPFGTVSGVANYGAGDILEITRTGGGESELYAFTQRTFPEIKVAARQITIQPPEILDGRKNADHNS